jgi:beta-lactamase class A
MEHTLVGILLFLALFQSASSLIPEFETIARKARGRVGSAVMLLETGETAGSRAGERFPMQSVFKLPIAIAVLHAVDQGKISLEDKIMVRKSDLVPQGNASVIRDQHPEGNFEISVYELLRVMMDVSDGTACDVLLRLAGGPAAVTEYVRSLGVNEMVIAISQKEMARAPRSREQNWASPRGALELLRVLQQGVSLSQANRRLLLQFMADSRTGPQRIKGLLPPGTVVSHKTGSSGTTNGVTHAIHDVGIVNLPNGKHVAIAVFVANSRAGEAMCERVIAEIARAAWDYCIGR